MGLPPERGRLLTGRSTRAGVAIACALALGTSAAAQSPPETVPAAEPIVAIEPAPPPPPPAPRPRLAIERLERAWHEPGADLLDRAVAARGAADELGVANLDPLAQAVLWDATAQASELQRAEAAALLAPDLPVAQAALARAQWQAGSFGSAFASARRAIVALHTHFPSWLWLGATAAWLGAAALALGALGFLAARAARALRFVAHDLGDVVEPSAPGFARVAAVAALALVPVALGEGLAGLALGMVALGFVASGRSARVAVGAAALLLVAAIHPLAQSAGARLAAISAEPAVRAGAAAESGFVDTTDALRLDRAVRGADVDPLALVAHAEWKRRAGDFAAADAEYAQLVEATGDVAILSNAAAVKLAMGDPNAAIDLYRRAIDVEPSAQLWFYLSQAHGAAIDVEQHDRALAAAQSMDRDAVSKLTERLARSPMPSAAALPLPQDALRERLLARDVAPAAAPFRARLAPGWIGRSLPVAIGAFALAAVLGALLGARVEPSAGCTDCGAHLCPRCGPPARGDGRCEACQRRRFEGRGAWDKGARSIAERARGFARWCLPGLLAARGAWAGLLVAIAASTALVFGLRGAALLPDPGSVGGAGPLAVAALVAACVAAHAAVAAIAGRIARGRP